MISPLSAAKTLCEAMGWGVSNLSMQKILYFSNMICLGQSKGANHLVSGLFEAWDYGPVLPSVYHTAKVFGSGFVGNVFHGVSSAPEGIEKEAIKLAANLLKDKKPGELVAITHWEDGAWAKNYRPGLRGIVIPDQDILEEYNRRVQQ